MAFPSLGQLCRQTAIANISKVTYIPSQLTFESIMSIMMKIGSSGVLKVILTNSPHLLDEPDKVDLLWERFCRKEFSSLLKQKMSQHSEECAIGIPFPPESWEEVYNELAIEHVQRIKADFEKTAASMRALEAAKRTNSTILVEDPRAIAHARPRGQSGASFRPRVALTPMQKIRERARLESFQRSQAMDKAKVESVVSQRNKDAQTSTQSQPSLSSQMIRKPGKSLSQRARNLEALRRQREASENYQRRTYSSSPEGPSAADKGSADKPAADQPACSDKPKSAAAKSAAESTPKTEMPGPSPPKKSTSSSIPSPQNPITALKSTINYTTPRLSQNTANKLSQAIKEKQIIKHTDGSKTTKMWVDWTKSHNRQILATFGRVEQDRLLAEAPVVVLTPAPGKTKRGSDAIDNTDNTNNNDRAAHNPSNSARTANSPPKEIASSPRPIKKARGAAGVFMPARRH